MDHHIRKAGDSDILVIQDLAHRIWPDTFGQILSQSQIDYMLDMMYSPPSLEEQMRRPGLQFFIVVVDAYPLGFMSLEAMSDHVRLHKLYVLTKNHGRGLGKAFMLQAREWAQNQDRDRILLNVNKHNEGAIGFYKALGFKILKEEDIDIGQGYWMNDYQMALDL